MRWVGVGMENGGEDEVGQRDDFSRISFAFSSAALSLYPPLVMLRVMNTRVSLIFLSLFPFRSTFIFIKEACLCGALYGTNFALIVIVV